MFQRKNSQNSLESKINEKLVPISKGTHNLNKRSKINTSKQPLEKLQYWDK